jgi:NADPH:quinone reductase-like Zn-dependent oxidoreductase
MKAIVLDQPGTPDTLHLAEMPQPEPKAGEVRVRVHAVGLNPADYKFALRGFRTWTYPFILGLDVAGTIDAIAPDVTDWNVGDAVYYHGNLSKPGGFAEYAIATACTIAPMPTGFSFAEAAAFPCSGFTAYQVLHHKLAIRPGQTVLVQGGSGGVGGFAIQLAALASARVITTCSAQNFVWVRQLGAADIIDYAKEEVLTQVKTLTHGRGVDAIVDGVSSASATAGLEMLAFGGGIACVNGLPDFAKLQSFGRALSVHDVALGGAHLSGDLVAQKQLAEIGQAFGEIARTHTLNPLLQELISIEEIPQALVRLSQRHVRGKIVAQIQ